MYSATAMNRSSDPAARAGSSAETPADPAEQRTIEVKDFSFFYGAKQALFDITLDGKLPARTPTLAIPKELQDPEDSSRVNAALSYKGSRKALQIIIAPPAWSGRWGLDRALKIGERFQAVGYINKTDNRLFRPVVFWYGNEALPVNQVLGNTLPVRAPLQK